MVLGNGSTAHVDASSYPDLFFAVRGAADSFGIISTYHFATLPRPTETINYSFGWQGLSPTQATDLFLRFQAFAQTRHIPSNFHLTLELPRPAKLDQVDIIIHGAYFSKPGANRFNSIIHPLVARLPPPSTRLVETLSWIDFLGANAEGVPLDADPLAEHHPFKYDKSVVTSKPFSAKSILCLMKRIAGSNATMVGAALLEATLASPVAGLLPNGVRALGWSYVADQRGPAELDCLWIP
jgi:hypothetical protein